MTTASLHRPSWPGKIAIAARDIKLAHSVFALPFALLGAFLGAAPGLGWRRFAGQVGLVVLCMEFARTWAMLANRVIDRRLDAENPRTAGRAFAAGTLAERDGLVMLAGSGLLFIAACAAFLVFFGNAVPLIASAPLLTWLAFYSYTKRFTLLCHLVLGLSLAASPLAAAVAIGGLAGLEPSVWWLAGFVACWVAGFDLIYAMQDEAFDREKGLRSIPAALGARGAAWASRGLHLLAIATLAGTVASDGSLNAIFSIAAAFASALLVAEHVVMAVRGPAGIPMAFFTLNGVVAIVLGAAGIADVLL